MPPWRPILTKSRMVSDRWQANGSLVFQLRPTIVQIYVSKKSFPIGGVKVLHQTLALANFVLQNVTKTVVLSLASPRPEPLKNLFPQALGKTGFGSVTILVVSEERTLVHGAAPSRLGSPEAFAARCTNGFCWTSMPSESSPANR